MYQRILTMVAAATLAGFMSAPLLAQFPPPPPVPPPPPLPNLEIHLAFDAPPPPRIEHRPHRPGGSYFWAQGSWDWQGERWAWVPGRWERPHAHGRWIAPVYVREDDGWRYTPGHWSNQHVVESKDYRHWKEKHRHDKDHGRDHDRGHGHDHDHDHD